MANNASKRRRLTRLIEKQDNLCHWCGLPMVLDIKPTAALRATYDHLDEPNPELDGPPRRAVAAHRICNNTRHYDDEVSAGTRGRARRAWLEHIARTKNNAKEPAAAIAPC